MADGTINVELRLLLDKLRQDVKKAVAEIKGGMATSVSGPSGADKAATAQDKLSAKVKKTTSALQEQLAAWKALHAGGIAPGMKITDASGSSSSAPGSPQYRRSRTLIAPLTPRFPSFNFAPPVIPRYSGPIPPVIPSGAGAAMLQGFSGVAGRLGLSGLTTALRAGPYAVAIAGVVAALLLMRKAVHDVVAAVEAARKMYAKQLQSGGLPGAFVARRALLAEVIGVGEHEVLAYGKAVGYLNQQVRFASQITAQTTPNLASVGWEFKLLAADIRAVVALMANELAPAMRIVVSGFRAIVEGIVNFVRKHEEFRDAMKTFFALWGNLMIGPMKFLGKDSGPAPPPSVGMQRMQASAWERMGLVIGTAGGSNPAKETARNTKATAEAVGKLHAAIMSRALPQSGVYRPYNMP